MSTVSDCRVLDLPRIEDPRGNLTFIEGRAHVPFEIRRVYWVYDVPGGQIRGGHAHRGLEEFIVSISGSFDVLIDDGREKRKVSLNRSFYGLHVPPMIWRHLENFSTNSVCLVLASIPYDRDDYLYDYEEYRLLKGGE